MTRKITIAAAQYPLDALKSLAEYEAKITRWVEEAVGQGADFMVAHHGPGSQAMLPLCPSDESIKVDLFERRSATPRPCAN